MGEYGMEKEVYIGGAPAIGSAVHWRGTCSGDDGLGGVSPYASTFSWTRHLFPQSTESYRQEALETVPLLAGRF